MQHYINHKASKNIIPFCHLILINLPSMIQKRQSFRLRIPWLFAPSSEVSKTEDKSKFPKHSDTNVPIQRLASPPKQPMITLGEFPPSPTKTKEPSHPTQPTISSVIIESPVPSQSTTLAPFQTPLPSFQPSSPHVGSPSWISLVSSSPKTQPQSPFHLASDGIIEVAKPTTEESFWPTLSPFEQEKEKRVVSEEPIPDETKPKVSLPLKAITKSPEATFQTEKMEIQPQGTEQKASSVPSTLVSKTEPTSDQSTPPPSSPLASQHTDGAFKRNVDGTPLPASPASKDEKDMVEAMSDPVPQETESKVKSPLKVITKSPEPTFQPERMSIEPQHTKQKSLSVPSTPVSKVEPTFDQPPHTSSPLALKHAHEVLEYNAEESTLPASPTSQEEKEKMVEAVSESVPQEAIPKVKSPLKTIPKSPETFFQHERMVAQPQDFEQQASSVPSSLTSKNESASDQSPPPSSPLTSKHSGRVLKSNVEESTLPHSLASQEGKEKMAATMFKPAPQEAESKIKSSLKTIPKSPEISFQPEMMATQPQDFKQQASSVPQFTVSNTEPTADQPRHLPSPLASDYIGEASKLLEESSSPASSAFQDEKKKTTVAMSELVPQEVEPKMKSPLKTISKSPEISSKPKILFTQPTPSMGNVKRSPTPETKKPDLDGTTESSKAPLETQSKLLESKEKEKEVHEPIKARKTKDKSTSQPSQHTMTHASRTKDKDPVSRGFHADKKQHGARETMARRLVFATSKLREKDIRLISSAYQRSRTVSSISLEKASLQKGIRDDISKFVHKLAPIDPIGIKGDISKFVHKLATIKPKQCRDDKEFSVISLAGDNKGAIMQFDSKAEEKERSIHICQDYQADAEESIDVIADVEENTKKDSHCLTNDDGVGKTCVNNNIQSINNSLMVHGSITESERSFQVTLPQNPTEPIKPNDKRPGSSQD